MKQAPEEDKANHKTENAAAKKRRQFITKLEWNFWANSAWAVLGLVAASFWATPVFDFMDDRMKIYSIAFGVCIALCIVTAFVAHSIVLHHEGRSSEQKDAQEEAYKKALRDKIDHLESELSNARQRLKKFEPRCLLEEDHNLIVECLSDYKGQKVYLCPIQDAEAKRYLQDIAQALEAAGWDVSHCLGSSYSNFMINFDNIQIAIAEECSDPPSQAAMLLAKAFGEIGIARNDGFFTSLKPDDVDDLLFPELRKGAIVIRIGYKPRGQIKE